MLNENLDPDPDRLSPVEREVEKVLRPQAFEDFTGQHKILANLRIFVQAAKLRGEALDHVLILDVPSVLSVNMMGISITLKPCWRAVNFISI